MEKSLILNSNSIRQKIERMVHEVHEKCFFEDEIILCGIDGNGNFLANLIAEGLNKISDLKVTVCSIYVNKDNPLAEEITCTLTKDFTASTIILIDDVCNSGKTIIYGASYFMRYNVKWIKTLVLVDRNHNRFPIQADFVGLTMSTTLKEHIEVSLKADEEAVYLI